MPKEAQKLVDAFQKKVTIARLQVATNQKKALASTIESLRIVQKKYTTEEKLDEAIAVRNYIRDLEVARKEGTYTLPSADDLADLPDDAQKIILDQEPLEDEESALEKALDGEREALVTRLTEMQGAFTKSERLDDALAIKEYLDAGVTFDIPTPVENTPKAPRKSRKITVPNITKGAGNFQQIQKNFITQQAEWQRQLLEAERATLDELAKKLTHLQGVHSRAERLEQAVMIKNLVTSIETERNAPAAMSTVRAMSPKLPKDAQAACEKALRADDSLRADITEGLSKLSEQLVKPLENESRRLLMDGKLDESRAILMSLCATRQPPIPFPYYHSGRHEGPRAYSEEVVEMLEKFSEESARRIEAADAKDAERRAELVRAMKALPAHPAIERTMQGLESDEAAGLRGMVLFQRDPDLPEAAATLVRDYRTQCRDAIAQLKADLEEAEKAFRPSLAAIRKKQIEKDELLSAFCTLLAESDTHYVFEPIPVKYATVARWEPNSDGKVLDVRDGFCLVLEWHGRTVWIPRSQVRSGHEIGKPAVQQPLPPGTPEPPPGRAITSKVKLQKGQRLMYKDFHGWTAVEVISIQPTGVEIGYLDQRGPSFNKIVTREELRDISED